MAKVTFDAAVGFYTETTAGTFAPELDSFTTAGTWSGDPDAVDEGLLLGDPESGIGETGLDFTIGRRIREKAVVSGSFTRPINDFLAAEVPTFTFAFPFCGNRGTASTPTTDADFTALKGVEALLNGAGLVQAATGGSPAAGQAFTFGSPNTFSALIYYFGNEIKLAGCRCSLSIDFTPGSVPIATATISVGTVYSPSAAGFSYVSTPTLDYGAQATQSAPTIESVANAWSATRGFQSLVLNVEPAIEDIPDSNATDGIVQEVTSRETTIEATLFADDTTAGTTEIYELNQVYQTAESGLAQLAFQVGSDATSAGVVSAVQLVVPDPELIDTSVQKLGSKGGNTVNLRATASTANQELTIRFR